MAEGGKEFNIGALPMDQLQQMRQNFVEENTFYENSYQQLRLAQSKFHESRESLKAINPENVGKEMMVPMTASLYVKGFLHDADSVLCDIGTGYFVEKTPKEADEYLKRKVGYLDENCNRIEAQITQKRKEIDAITTVMQAKAQQMQASQQGAAKED